MAQGLKMVVVEALPFGRLASALASLPPEGLVALYWLGGAGVALQASNGACVFIDPYLSDLCERRHGFRRLTPAPLRAEEAAPEVWIATHHHADHLDVDAVTATPRRETIAFAAPPSCLGALIDAGVPREHVTVLLPGTGQQVGSAYVTAVPADHGALAPDAVGVVVDFAGVRLYHAGDTALRDEFVAGLRALAPQIAVLPINGKFGNLTPVEAAQLADAIGVQAVVPCHYWLLAEHGGDPGAFAAACSTLAPRTEPLLVPLGGRCLFRVVGHGQE
jgi:L-ascorbate 6-phosphate lactonase